jgi:hypothetical protein
MKHRTLITWTFGWLVGIIFALSPMTLASCATNTPPVITPAAQAAVSATQVIKALDVVRDTAVDLNAATPPILSNKVLLQIVTFHESAVKVILAAPSGWKATVLAALGQLQTDLSPADYQRIVPYVALVQTLIASVA